MNLRRILLKVMLWSLGVGAVLGAGSILVASNEAVWRIVGTCITTAVAALVMLGCAILMDKPKSHAAGLVGMIAVLIEYFLALLLIWEIPQPLGYRVGERIGLSMVLGGIVVLVLVAALRARENKLTRTTGTVGIALCAVELGLLMIAIWGEPLWRDDRWWQTTGFFAMFGAITLAALVGSGTGDGRWWRWIGVVGSIIAFAAAMKGTWSRTTGYEALFAFLVLIASYPAFANIVMLCPLKAGQNWLRMVTLAAALVAGACFVAAIHYRFGPSYDLVARIGGAAAIIGGCGSLALLVLAKLNRRVEFQPEAIDLKEMAIVCPVCRRKQTVPFGDSACAGCGLKFQISVHEPRCPSCNYLLLMIHSPRCPECGASTQAALSAG